MTAAPDTLADLLRDLERALDLMDKKRPEYEKARDMYEGKALEIGGSKVADRIIEQSQATPISFAHIPVDVIVDKCEIGGITAADANAQRSLTTWLEGNDLEDEVGDWLLKAGYFGDYYAVTDPTGIDADGRFTIEDVASVGMSPLSTIVMYDRKTTREAQYGVHVWDTASRDGKRKHAVIYYHGTSVKLVNRNGSDNVDDFDFDYVEDPEEAYLDHDGETLLIAHLAVGSKPYGTPLHRRAWAFQDAIAKISANNLVNVDALGLPSRWALLDPVAEIDDDLDGDFGTNGPATVPSQGDGLTKASGTARVRTVPGAIAMLRGIKEVGTFDQGDGSSFYAGMDWYVRGMAVACGVPLFEFDMSGEQPSGESRRRAEGRANRAAAKLKRQAGNFLREIADTVLGLVGAASEVAVTWNPSETATDKDGLELVALKVKAGVPLRQALLEAGYTEAQVAEWYPKDSPALSPDLVTLYATALAALGNAKTLGALTDGDLVAMLPELLTAARGEGPVDPSPSETGIVLDAGSTLAQQVKAQADALGVLIRSGVDQEEAAARVGLEGLTFPNLPTTIRVPESETVGIEQA